MDPLRPQRRAGLRHDAALRRRSPDSQGSAFLMPSLEPSCALRGGLLDAASLPGAPARRSAAHLPPASAQRLRRVQCALGAHERLRLRVGALALCVAPRRLGTGDCNTTLGLPGPPPRTPPHQPLWNSTSTYIPHQPVRSRLHQPTRSVTVKPGAVLIEVYFWETMAKEQGLEDAKHVLSIGDCCWGACRLWTSCCRCCGR
jgi:hypothetical protein